MARRGRTLARGLAVTALLAGAAGADGPAPARAPPAPQPDMDLIEFLGSVDSDDANWRAWLARSEEQVPKPEKVSAPQPPPASRKKDEPVQDDP